MSKIRTDSLEPTSQNFLTINSPLYAKKTIMSLTAERVVVESEIAALSSPVGYCNTKATFTGSTLNFIGGAVQVGTFSTGVLVEILSESVVVSGVAGWRYICINGDGLKSITTVPPADIVADTIFYNPSPTFDPVQNGYYSGTNRIIGYFYYTSTSIKRLTMFKSGEEIPEFDVGRISSITGLVVPKNYVIADGSILSRTTYGELFDSITLEKGIFTINVGSNLFTTPTAHGLVTGDCVSLTTTGSLPTGVTASTNYFFILVSPTTFRLATTLDNATIGTFITLSGGQSGVHSMLYNPWGISGASNFLLPDGRASFLRGTGTSTRYTANKTIGLGHYNNDAMQGHRHPTSSPSSYNIYGNGSTGAYPYSIGMGTAGTFPLLTTGDANITDGTNGTPRTWDETASKSLGVTFIIKYTRN